MLEPLRELVSIVLDTTSFPARWYCGSWTPLHGWIHITADLMVAGAYLAIPLVIFFFTLRRRDVPFPRVFWLFGAFIIACGTTHFIEAIIFWEPVYRLSAIAKVTTAAVSWVTVIALVQVVPQALRYPRLEALNHKLKQANDDLESFAKIVSHDLRAPLRGIFRATDELEQAFPQPDTETRAALELLRNRANKLDAMINGILLYSKAGEANTQLADVSTRAVVEDVKLSLSPEQRGRVELHGDFPVIRADGVQVYQIFQNLIENALRYTSGGSGKILIVARPGQRSHRFLVEDGALAIAPEEQERIFQIFRPEATGDPFTAGLGLAIARKVLEKNGGKIWLETPVDGGSRFVFTWPVMPPRDAVPAVTARAQ